MIRIMLTALALGLVAGLASMAVAAGGGGAAGGSGHQRAINSGLPAGEAGPPGSSNNPRPTPTAAAPVDSQQAPKPEPTAKD